MHGKIHFGECSNPLTKTKIEIEIGKFKNTLLIGSSQTQQNILLQNIFIDLIEESCGQLIFDFEDIYNDDFLNSLPNDTRKKVKVFDPLSELIPGLNIIQVEESTSEIYKQKVISNVLHIIYEIFDEKSIRNPIFETYFVNTLKLAMSHPESGNSLFVADHLLKNEDYRSFKLAMCEDMNAVDFWEKSNANGYTYTENQVEINSLAIYIFSKLAPFLNNPIVSNVISQPKTAIDFNKIVNGELSLVIKLPKNKLDDESIKIFKYLFLAYIDLEFSKIKPENITNKPVVMITDFENFLIEDTLSIISKYSNISSFICSVNNPETLKTESKNYYKLLQNVIQNVIEFKNSENSKTFNLRNDQAYCNISIDDESVESLLIRVESKAIDNQKMYTNFEIEGGQTKEKIRSDAENQTKLLF